MNTIQVTIKDLIATAQPDRVIVSDNTGYRVQFVLDEAWDPYSVKTAVFLWNKKLETFCTSVAFEGDTVAVPKLPAVSKLWVGLTAGNLQTTTAAEIPCVSSVLGNGGQEPEPPTESEYGKIMELLNGKIDPVSEIAVTEAADGTVTMVNTLAEGTETIVLTPDASGNPSKLSYNGKEIPISWAVSG
jgi:hypothetical protein